MLINIAPQYFQITDNFMWVKFMLHIREDGIMKLLWFMFMIGAKKEYFLCWSNTYGKCFYNRLTG